MGQMNDYSRMFSVEILTWMLVLYRLKLFQSPAAHNGEARVLVGIKAC